MNYKEHENGLMEIYCFPSEVPTVIRLLTVRATQIEEEKAMKAAQEVAAEQANQPRL